MKTYGGRQKHYGPFVIQKKRERQEAKQEMNNNIPIHWATEEEIRKQDEADPYTICDGKWGGWGDVYWYNKADGEYPKNVFEVEKTVEDVDDDNYRVIRSWKRVWDDDLKVWRRVTEKEKQFRKDDLLKTTEHTRHIFKNETFAFPVIKAARPEINFRDIMTVQPMSGKTRLIAHYD